MPMEFIRGDLFQGDHRVILHGCNAKGKFGKGFADAVKKAIPVSAEAYFAAHNRSALVLGSVIWASDGRHLVGNCITQATYGNDGKRHVSYEAIRDCMRAVNLTATTGIPGTAFEGGFPEVAMPLIGADLAGGDWEIISGIIEQELTNVRTVVYVLPGKKFDIPARDLFSNS